MSAEERLGFAAARRLPYNGGMNRAEVRAAADRALARRRAAVLPVPAPSSLGPVDRPAGPSGLRVLATLLSRRRAANELYEQITRAHHPVAHTRMAGEHVYLVSDPELVIEVFLNHGRDLMKGRGLQATRPLLGNGLLTSEGELHRRQRRLAQPAFHRDRIVGYAAQMVTAAELQSQRWHDEQDVDMVEEMTSLTFAIVGRTLFGTDLSGDTRLFRDTLEELMAGFSRLSVLGNERLIRALPMGRNLLARTGDLDVVVGRIIAEHREQAAAGRDAGDLLSWFVRAEDDGQRMTDEQLRDEVMTMVLAGHETTAMALSWAWWLLATHRTAADRLRSELDAELGGRAPTFTDLDRLPYARAVVAEAIRLYPPAWVIGRRSLVDLRVGGWQVPSGSILLAVPYSQHRDPAVWAHATEFRPQRWLTAAGGFDEAAPGVPRGSWIPFGFGNRRCIGEQFAWTEAVLVLATLAARWQVRSRRDGPVSMLAGVTLRPRHGLPMTLARR
jgi:cytochrome P450